MTRYLPEIGQFLRDGMAMMAGGPPGVPYLSLFWNRSLTVL